MAEKLTIRVIGVGGGGNNALNRIAKLGLSGVQLVGINTDEIALSGCIADEKLVIGKNLTKGHGAGSDVELGRSAALASEVEIRKLLEGSDLVFVTAGQGGGTGTGAAPVIAKIARDEGAMIIGVVTTPFSFEGRKRSERAHHGLRILLEVLDLLVVIPNDSLLSTEMDFPLVQAFKLSDDIIAECIRSISDLLLQKGLLNLEFGKIRRILKGAGIAYVGIGGAEGNNRAQIAARLSLSSPLLRAPLDRATKVLINVSGGYDLTLFEVNEVAETVAASVDPTAQIIFGGIPGTCREGELKVTVFASGFRGDEIEAKADDENGAMIKEENAGRDIDIASYIKK